MEGKLLRSATLFAKQMVGLPMGFEFSAFLMNTKKLVRLSFILFVVNAYSLTMMILLHAPWWLTTWMAVPFIGSLWLILQWITELRKDNSE